MNENEARNLWCPMIQIVVGRDLIIDNRGRNSIDNKKDVSFTCIASICAMWRWISRPDSGLNKSDWEGYCGLGGRP